MSDYRNLIEKLRRIEALFEGAKTDGERTAAESAIRRIAAKLELFDKREPAVEYRFSLDNPWSRTLLVALLRRYGLKPYRRYRQRRTTVMARVSPAFVDETLWPEFCALNSALQEHIDAITKQVIEQAIHEDVSDAPEVRGELRDRRS